MRKFVVTLIALLVGFAASLAGAEDATRFPTLGVSVQAPPHARFEEFAMPGRIGLFRFDEQSPCPGAGFGIDYFLLGDDTVDQLAQHLATVAGGSVEAVDVKVDGEKAVKVSAPLDRDGFTHQDVYLVGRGDRVFAISAFSTPAANALPTVQTLLSTVKFFPPESPMLHLDEFYTSRLGIFNRFTIRLPNGFKSHDPQPTSLIFGTDDYSNSPPKHPFAIEFNAMKFRSKPPFAKLCDSYTAHQVQQFGLKSPLVWTDSKTVAGLHIAATVKATIKTADGWMGNQSIRIAMQDLDPGEFIEIVFKADTPKPETAAAFEKACDEVLASIKPMKK